MVGTTNKSIAAMSGAWLRRKVRHPCEAALPLDHVFGDARLSDLKAELEQFAMDARRAPQRVLDTHPPDQRPQIRSICGRPPKDRDFQRQYRRKPARCQRTRVSGRMIVIAFRTEGNHRYSWIKNKRSPFVSWTRPLHLAPQHDQLMSECRILSLKPALRLER